MDNLKEMQKILSHLKDEREFMEFLIERIRNDEAVIIDGEAQASLSETQKKMLEIALS